eukprot:CAMPEP_0176028082 /NCGR_PEP_ID=MMETSP0120_2-20121206/13779_1 /TAXON_ID=160619 /ORGANISM="Kryptoperidinium foliaceum, Strain CCMP 1326" /LENGTH=92 /DNA_ID=CAMNT_0017361291 /DNA_START=10 /DNA_END=285 /DNA_ORIENTATION=+
MSSSGYSRPALALSRGSALTNAISPSRERSPQHKSLGMLSDPCFLGCMTSGRCMWSAEFDEEWRFLDPLVVVAARRLNSDAPRPYRSQLAPI